MKIDILFASSLQHTAAVKYFISSLLLVLFPNFEQQRLCTYCTCRLVSYLLRIGLYVQYVRDCQQQVPGVHQDHYSTIITKVYYSISYTVCCIYYQKWAIFYTKKFNHSRLYFSIFFSMKYTLSHRIYQYNYRVYSYIECCSFCEKSPESR
jgi:hypothetical protein